jgi:nitrate ABC transporter ATP-binding subunit
MSVFVEVDHVDRVFKLPEGGNYIALKNIELHVHKGEFVSLVGHSGCGKSTLLNILSGLDQPTAGGIVLEGREVTEPGPDRMVVFQNYSLLPWLTVKENVALAVHQVMQDRPKHVRDRIIAHHLEMVGLSKAADKLPGQISGGMKQRVAIARALAIRPKLLLLDEPFGALDALTRGGLQEQLMKICQENEVTCVMVTHDVDEALLLSDRIVLMTNGPEAHVGQVVDVPFARPRERMEVVKHPNYYSLRNEIVYFLNQQKRAKLHRSKPIAAIAANGLEKINLELGFIPLMDCAPLVVAKEKGFFKAHGLSEVTLNREPSWNAIADGVATGRLDAAAMVAGMPLGMTLGYNNQPSKPMVSALTLSRNGDAITFSKRLYDQGVHSLADFKAAIDRRPDQVHTLAAVHPTSMQNLLLRYWLASGGIDPDRDVSVTAIPSTQMVSNLKNGTIDGYCVGEPWNAQAVQADLGVVMALDNELWPGHIEKVLGVTEAWADDHPKAHIALVKALLQACEYCDDPRNRKEILDLLCRPEYVGTEALIARRGFLGARASEDDIESAQVANYVQFFTGRSNFPDVSEAVWIMTQMARWGLTPFPRNWLAVAERVKRSDIFGQAARELGRTDVGRDRNPIRLFDGVRFDPDQPLKYLEKFAIKRDLRIEEVPWTNDSVVSSR